jgi:hypothetical protein
MISAGSSSSRPEAGLTGFFHGGGVFSPPLSFLTCMIYPAQALPHCGKRQAGAFLLNKA